MLRINGTQKVADIEAYYFAIANAVHGTDLQISRGLDWKIGSKGAFLQFLITWAKQSNEEALVTYIDHPTQIDNQLDNLLSTDHGLIACLVAPEILTRRRDHSIKNEMPKRLLRRLDDTSNRQYGIRGSQVFLVCADEFPKAYLPSSLYFNGILRTTEDFESLAARVIDHYNTYLNLSTTNYLDHLSLGKLFKELFGNTDDWAKNDVLGREIRNSVRGITCSMHSFSNVETLSSANDAFGSKSIKDFLDSFQTDSNEYKRHFLEINVFDSGPGLAQRWLDRYITNDCPLLEEYKAITECLQRHSSSTKAVTKGYGLHEAMLLLTKLSGFWRLRSGRLSLYRNFATEPYEPDDRGKRNKPSLLDWYSHSNELKQQAPVQGTLWTIILPYSEPIK